MNVNAFLRWAAVNMLLGSWDNYYATRSNYYLYNSGRRGAAKDFVGSPYFHFIPWDYDNCLGIDYSGTQWQYADILDWPGKVNRHTPKIPLVRNLLRNHDYRQYYVDYLEHMLDTEFNPGAIAARIGARSEDGLWHRPTGSLSGIRYTLWETVHWPTVQQRRDLPERLPAAPTAAWEEDDRGHRPLRSYASRQRPRAAGNAETDNTAHRRRLPRSGRTAAAGGLVGEGHGTCPTRFRRGQHPGNYRGAGRAQARSCPVPATR